MPEFNGHSLKQIGGFGVCHSRSQEDSTASQFTGFITLIHSLRDSSAASQPAPARNYPIAHGIEGARNSAARDYLPLPLLP